MDSKHTSFLAVVAVFGTLFFFMFRGFAADDRDRCQHLYHQARSHSDTLIVSTAAHCEYLLP